MTDQGLSDRFKYFLQLPYGSYRDYAYKTMLYPYLNSIIFDVQISLGIPKIGSSENSLELFQVAHLHLLSKICTKEDVDKIHKMKDYIFIVVRRCLINELKNKSRYEKFKMNINSLAEEAGLKEQE